MTDPKSQPVNKKKLLVAVIMLIIALLALAGILFLPDRKNPQDEMPRLTFEKQGYATIKAPDGTVKAEFDLEIADTEETQKTGLMYRESMADNQGMLFTYKEADKMNFWMKNTYLPLDIIFFLPDSTIYKVYADNKPFTEAGVAPAENCLFALEINAGLGKKFSLQPGDKLDWKRLPR